MVGESAKRKYLEIGKPFVFDSVGFPKRNVIFRGATDYFRSRRRVFVRVCVISSGIDLPSFCGVTVVFLRRRITIIAPQLRTSLEIILFHIIHSTGV